MASISKRAPVLVFAAIFLAFGLIGWAARAALGQDAKKDPAPPPLPAATPAEPPATLQDALVAPSEAVKPAPSLEAVGPPPRAHAAETALPGPELGFSSGVPSAIPAPAPAQALAPSADVGVGSTADDPEKSALAFVEQNQKMAESQLKRLKAEEAKLRERLLKVEAGIKRWESLVGALKQSQGSVVIVGPGNLNSGNWKQADPDEPGPQRPEPMPVPKSKLNGVKK